MEVIIRQHEQECGATVADIFDRAVRSGQRGGGFRIESRGQVDDGGTGIPITALQGLPGPGLVGSGAGRNHGADAVPESL